MVCVIAYSFIRLFCAELPLYGWALCWSLGVLAVT